MIKYIRIYIYIYIYISYIYQSCIFETEDCVDITVHLEHVLHKYNKVDKRN